MWSNDKCLEFIEAIEVEEAIWNPKHENHKDKNILHDAWRGLEEKFSTPIKVLKQKKENLFTTYRKYARKIADSKKTGSGEENVYKPTWYLYEAIDRFLNSVYTPGKTINSLEIEHNAESDDDTIEREEANLLEPEQSMEIAEVALHTLPSTSSAVVKKMKATNRKLTQTEQIKNRMDEAVEVLKKVASQPTEPTSLVPKDHLELFTSLLLAKLRGLSENNQEIAMHEIDNLMFKLKNPTLRRHLESEVLQGQLASTSGTMPPTPAYWQQPHTQPIYTQPPLPFHLQRYTHSQHSPHSQQSLSPHSQLSISPQPLQSQPSPHSQQSQVSAYSEPSASPQLLTSVPPHTSAENVSWQSNL